MPKLFLLIGVVIVASAAHAQPRNALEAYSGEASFAATMCGLTFVTGQAQAEIIRAGGEVSAENRQKGDYRACVRDQKPAVKTAYDAALKTVRKPAAKAALKNHYVAAISQLDGIVPELDERKIDYERRQAANAVRAKEAWIRFEAEN